MINLKFGLKSRLIRPFGVNCAEYNMSLRPARSQQCMKYNTSITLHSFSRVNSPARRMAFKGLSALLLILAMTIYWRYLHGLSHVSNPALVQIVSEAKTLVKPAPDIASTAPVLPAVKNSVSQMPSTLTPAVKSPVAQAEAVPAAATPVIAQPARSAIIKALPASIVAQRSPASRPLSQFKESDQLLKAGQQAFYNLLDAARAYPDAYGFLPDDSLQLARLGAPIQVYQVTEQDCVRYRAGQPVKPLLKPMARWEFPVFIGDQIRCMVQVTYSGHNYVPGDGSKMLGMSWNKILAKWPASKGFHPQLLVNPEIPCFYFTVPELDVQNVTDTNEMIFSDDADLSPAAVILASWR
jgi:hypothetical protein